MEINRENYGRYVVDYYDGRLSEKEAQRLMLFLAENQDCKLEFDSFESFTLDKPIVVFPEKDRLKQKEIAAIGIINEDNFEAYFVLDQDNELGEKEEKSVEDFLHKNLHLKGEYDLLSQIHIKPEISVVYYDKTSLKHQTLLPLYRNFALAAAAVLLLLFGFRFMMPAQKPIERQGLSQIKLMNPMTEHRLTLISPEIQTAILMPIVKVSVPADSNLKKNSILPPLQTMASLSSRLHLQDTQVYVDLLFPKGETVHESLAIIHPIVIEESGKSSLIKRAFEMPFAKIGGLFARNFHKHRGLSTGEKGLVRILDSGVTAVNTLTNNDNLILAKTYDQQGNLLAFQLVSDRFNIRKKMRPVSSGD